MGTTTSKSASNIQLSSIFQQKRRLSSSINDEKFDIFTLIWFDEKSNDISSWETLRTQALFKQVNNNKNCLFYNSPIRFLNYLHEMKFDDNNNRKNLLVISGIYARKYLDKIHNDVSIIIIFCKVREKYLDLKETYSNIIEICTEYETLKNSIQRELPSLKFNLFHNQSLKSLRPIMSSLDDSDHNDNVNHSAYFSYVSFVDIIKQMSHTEEAKRIMISKCKDYYRGNKVVLEKIEDFRKTYRSDKVIEWYTKDSFVYRLINHAFRTEDIALWYLFRFYIIDLCKQLESVHRIQQQQQTDCF
ncbi:unnamed protein product [Didymodactylos carnosus]|uniref:Uncharacterized protein n=1 Tax=Didymodactylos carnosus TaxID=1234261 RepID=A0A8S2YIU0_9BILA|nr:unnamed protein product [Didymodactylos carnosus]